ncbi:hypothetical protein HC891_24990, partial [Candidatus Gracilibacteria bacterium]|nr:hypothetical protein [Candidatus Gracilibacteria bacterium]
MSWKSTFSHVMVAALVLGLLALGGVALAATSVPQQAEVADTIEVNGQTRRFVYAISAQPAPATGRPLVIHLHGDGGNIDGGLSAAWKSAVLNDANGAVLLAAEGRNNIPETFSGSTAWRFRMDEAGTAYDDVDFIDQVIAAAKDENLLGTAIDPAQIYVVGESRGGGHGLLSLRRSAYERGDPGDRADLRHFLLRGRRGERGPTRYAAHAGQRHDMRRDQGVWLLGAEARALRRSARTAYPCDLRPARQWRGRNHPAATARPALRRVDMVELGGGGRLLCRSGECRDRSDAARAYRRQDRQELCLQPVGGKPGDALCDPRSDFLHRAGAA